LHRPHPYSKSNFHSDSNTYANTYADTYADTYANPYADTYADTAGKHLRHCHLLLESDPAPSFRRDDEPDWSCAGAELDADRWLG